ncbi:MAG: GDP-mannose 4,6-dehydratase [Alphaproteobacteria bacterium]|nr:GDP-mannose 4,6-dehydratase [Alphaproteobacteria bacterium]
MPTALITGVTGQDGSFLAEQLLARGWRVVGVARRSASPNPWRIAHLLDRPTDPLELREGDLLDLGSLIDLMREVRPDHVYNLAAQSFVPTSWRQPLLTGDVTALGAARMLEALRLGAPDARFYQASSSEMFGLAEHEPQDLHTPFHPRSPYGVAKVYAHHLTVNYRESHGLFVVSGILFNHESERRGNEFVTRKVTRAVAAIETGRADHLTLGRLDVKRDWGFAGDYTRAMTLMLEQDAPRDHVIATGRCHSVQDFVSRAFAVVGRDWRAHVRHDEALLRPAEIPSLRGDPAPAHRALGWSPTVDFDQLVERMVHADLDRARRGLP